MYIYIYIIKYMYIVFCILIHISHISYFLMLYIYHRRIHILKTIYIPLKRENMNHPRMAPAPKRAAPHRAQKQESREISFGKKSCC